MSGRKKRSRRQVPSPRSKGRKGKPKTTGLSDEEDITEDGGDGASKAE